MFKSKQNVPCLSTLLLGELNNCTNLTQVNFMKVPLLPQGADLDVTVFSIQEQRLVDVLRGAFQLLPVHRKKDADKKKKHQTYTKYNQTTLINYINVTMQASIVTFIFLKERN